MGKFKVSGERILHFQRQKSYWQQAVSQKEYVRNALVATGIVAVTAWLFFRAVGAVIILCPLGIKIYKFLEEEEIRKKQQVFLTQFKEMTETLASGMRVGYSVENAWKETEKEMRMLYPEQNVLGDELDLIVRQIRLQVPVEQVLEEFAGRVNLEDVTNFVLVFKAAKRSGGDMIGIMKNTVRQIGDKIDVKREIDTLLAAKQYEFRVMCVIPYVMIAYMRLSFPEFMSALYGNALGIGVMSVCLVIFVCACLLGAKLIRIEV